MAKKQAEEIPRIKLGNKILAIPTIIFLYLLWFTDRLIHLLLFHATHLKLTEWIRAENSMKYSITRVLIITFFVVMYKLVW